METTARAICEIVRPTLVDGDVCYVGKTYEMDAWRAACLVMSGKAIFPQGTVLPREVASVCRAARAIVYDDNGSSANITTR